MLFEFFGERFFIEKNPGIVILVVEPVCIADSKSIQRSGQLEELGLVSWRTILYCADIATRHNSQDDGDLSHFEHRQCARPWMFTQHSTDTEQLTFDSSHAT